MLSDKTLERVSVSYRKGYKDGYFGWDKQLVATGIEAPFADFDYERGYEAGANERFHEEKAHA